MTTTPNEPLRDDDMETLPGSTGTTPGAVGGPDTDADGTDADGKDAHGTDADGTDADTTDSDSDATDA